MRFADVLAIAEFRVLWIAQTQSRAGDHLARVALALVVFDATTSAALTALTYALTYLPPLLSGPLVGGLADRYPRRTLLVLHEAISAVLVAIMAIPGMPLAVMIGLLTITVATRPLFVAARSALVPNLLSGDRLVVGLGLLNITEQSAQVLGFACGGVLVGLFGPHVVLAADAVTFAICAVLLRYGLRHRPAATGRQSARGSLAAGARLIWSDPRLRSLTLLTWCYGCYVASEGLAAPYADEVGGGAAAAGLLMATGPVGAGIGALIVTRWVPPRVQPRLIAPMATLAAVPFLLTGVGPALPWTLVLWTVSGGLTAYFVLCASAFLGRVPDAQRGQAIGLSNSGLQAAQGLGILLAGALADLFTPSLAIAACGALGAAGTLYAGAAWHRAERDGEK